MRRFLSFLLLLVSVFVLVGCTEKVLDFEVPEQDTAYLGEFYDVKPMIGKDQDGNEYIASYVVQVDGQNVEVSNNRFEVTSLEDYHIIYSIEFNKEVIERTTVVVVEDNENPRIVVGDFEANVILNDVVDIPEITVVDNSNQTLVPTVEVFYKDTDEQAEVSNNSFVANQLGYYTIKITAFDANSNSSTKEIVVMVRAAYEIEGFNNSDFLLNQNSIGLPNNAQIEYNTNEEYIVEGEGSLKFISPDSMEQGSYPELVLNNPAIQDVSTFRGISLFIYNANPHTSRVNISNRIEGWFDLEPYQWTEIRIMSSQYDDILPGVDFSGETTASKHNLDNLRIYFEKASSDEEVYYIDGFRVLEEDEANVENVVNSENPIVVGNSLDINLLPNITAPGLGGLTVNLVDRSTGVRTLLTEENKNVVFNTEGQFYVEYLFTDKANKINVYYDNLYVIQQEVKSYGTLEDFSQNSDLIFKANSQTILSMNQDANYILNGTGSLEAKVDVNDGYPFIYVDKARFENYLDMHDYIEINIFNAGVNNHEMHINAVTVAQLVPGLNTIKLSKDQFRHIVENDVVANGLDSNVYKQDKVTFFIFNVGNSNEGFSLFFDSIVGGFNDREVEYNTSVNLDDLLNNPCLGNFVLKNEGEVVSLNENTFMVEKLSFYELTFTATKAGFESEEFKITIMVNYIEPEINGDYLDFESEADLAMVGNAEGILSINNNLNFVCNGNSSMKFYTTGGYPALVLLNEHITKLDEFDYLYINVFNDGMNNHDGYIATYPGTYYRFTLKAKQWNVIRLTNDELKAAVANPENASGVKLVMFNEIGVSYEELNLYFDNIHYGDSLDNPVGTIHDFKDVSDILQAESTLEVNQNLKYILFGDSSLKLSSSGGYPDFRLPQTVLASLVDQYELYTLSIYNDGNNNHDGYITIGDGDYVRFTLLSRKWTTITLSQEQMQKALVYNSEFLKVNVMNDGGSNESLTIYVDGYYGYNTANYGTNGVLTFALDDDINYMSHRGSAIEMNTNPLFVKTDSKSVKYSTTDGYPQIKVSNALLQTRLNDFDYFSFNIYNDGSNLHTGYLTLGDGNYKRFALAPKAWSTIVLTKAELEQALSYSANTDFLVFDIANDGNSYEALTLYFDSVIGHNNNQ